MGKNRLPAPKLAAPISGRVTVQTLAGPIRLEQSSTTTMPHIRNS